MAVAASDLLDALDDSQRRLALWPFPSDDERRLWFYTPTDHGGVTVGALRPRQQRLVMALLASGLSRAAYVSVATIIGLENVLGEVEGFQVDFDRERGRDPGQYYVRIFGTPAPGATWSWRFGGHHVSVNQLVVDGRPASSTPLFLGADPASSPLLGPHLLRPLAGAEDLARELVIPLDPAPARTAIVSPVAPTDLVGGNRPELSPGDLPLGMADIWRDRFGEPHRSRWATVQQHMEQTLGLNAGHLDAVRYTATPKGLTATSLTQAQQ